MAEQGLAMPLAIIVSLLIGGAVGSVNGLLVTRARVNAVVVTFGLGTMLIGLAYGYTAGSPIVQVPAALAHLTLGRTLSVQSPIWFMAVVLGLLWLALNRTPLGQRIQAIGVNTEAARLAGVRVDRAKIAAYVIAGACAAITAVLLASLLGSGTVSATDGYLVDSFAAVFIGSTMLRDGRFHIVGALVGVLVVNVGFNGLSQLGIPTFWQYIFKGGILVLAVALSTPARRDSGT